MELRKLLAIGALLLASSGALLHGDGFFYCKSGGGVANTGNAAVGDVTSGKTFSSAVLTNATGTSTKNATVPNDALIQPAQAFVDACADLVLITSGGSSYLVDMGVVADFVGGELAISGAPTAIASTSANLPRGRISVSGVGGMSCSANFPHVTNLRASIFSGADGNPCNLTIDFPSLQSVTNLISFYYCAFPSNTLSFPSLTSPGPDFEVYGSGLTTVILPSQLATVEDGCTINFADNALSTAEVNSLLHKFATAATLGSGGTLDLSGQTPPAPPSGQGITDAATLTGAGWTVTTD